MFSPPKSFVVVIKELQAVYQRISSIGYGFRVKLECSKTSAGGSHCQLAVVISWHIPLLSPRQRSCNGI